MLYLRSCNKPISELWINIYCRFSAYKSTVTTRNSKSLFSYKAIRASICLTLR